ncbi:MraY family glycosyltransferase [Niveibacterium sp.]|uniref:MraY family glycosyltransferase n=1 Tax=Niveibacterium sp. TaxID=2017444 RepID=UPI0035B462F5
MARLLARVAGPLRLLDTPDARKQHEGAVPIVGGLAVVLGGGLVLFAFGLAGGLQAFLGPVMLLLLLGVFDDVYGFAALPKLLVQLVAAVWLVYGSGLVLTHIPLPFLSGHMQLHGGGALLTVFVVVASINAINMIDGLDGLAGGVLMLGFLNVAAAAAMVGRVEVLAPALVCAGAIAGFLLWNVRFPWQAKARIFLGDAGALALSMLLCALAMSLSLSPASGRVPVTVAFAVVAVPLADMLAVSVWRLRSGRNPMAGDRRHAHHLLLALGLGTNAVVFLIWTAALLTGAVTLLAWRFNVAEGRLLGVLLCAASLHLVWLHRMWAHVHARETVPQ